MYKALGLMIREKRQGSKQRVIITTSITRTIVGKVIYMETEQYVFQKR